VIVGTILGEDSVQVFYKYFDYGDKQGSIKKTEIRTIILENNNSKSIEDDLDRFSFGIGAGQDFGGYGGISLLLYPNSNFGIFAGLGNAIVKPGFNVGIKCRLIDENIIPIIVPSILVMYGYNTIVKAPQATQYYAPTQQNDMLLYGLTIGLGTDIRLSHKSKNFFTFNLFLPIRSTSLQSGQQSSNAKNTPWPVTLSIGYRMLIF
jgi:hypothetical protein